MCVNIGSSADVTMPQPFLNFFQAHTIGVQQTGTAMSQIMKTYLFQPVLCQQNIKMLGNEIGLHQFSNGIHIHVFQIVVAVAAAANLTVDFLLLFYFPQ